MPQIHPERLRPGYNATAAVGSLIAAPAWAHALTASTSAGPLAPLGLTAAAFLTVGVANWAVPCWPTRAALYVPATALAISPAAAHAVLTFTTGAHP
jgi:hypothetical protein